MVAVGTHCRSGCDLLCAEINQWVNTQMFFLSMQNKVKRFLSVLTEKHIEIPLKIKIE
jgi:hypothetical protein